MAGRGFSVKIQLDLHAITCPGVWLCPNGKVALQINTLDSSIESHRIEPVFPLLFHDKFTFNKVFTRIVTLTELQHNLKQEFLYAELVQWVTPSSRGIILASFETNLVDILYPAPCYKGLLAGIDVDLLMEPSKYFPGIIAPKIEISTRTVIEEVLGICDSHINGPIIINPKTISSKQTSCINRKRPVKGILRQRRVCHSHGKPRAQIRRPYCQKSNNLERTNPSNLEHSFPCTSDDHLRSQCYHEAKRKSKYIHESPSPERTLKNVNVCNDVHIFDSCPVCLKYKCYFSGHCDEYGGLEKHIYKHKENLRDQEISNCIRQSSDDALNCSCRPNSAPIPREESAISVLRSKIKNLQKSRDKIPHADGDSKTNRYYTMLDDLTLFLKDLFSVSEYPNYDDEQHCRKEGFYRNLEKFYKRMYKQARQRAQEVE